MLKKQKGLKMVTKELLHELFEYRNGALFWKKVHKFQPYLLGKEAGCMDKSYKRINLNNKLYGLHQIIFLYHYGYIPTNVDHIDGNKLNNFIENLREATHSQNQHNKKASKTNTSGFKNVTWCKTKNQWKVHLMVNKKMNNIGYFEDIELADLAAIEAREKYHGNFAKHQ